MKDGKLRAIAVTSAARAPMAPNVPSVQELEQKKLVAENFLGVSGPAGLPRPVVDRLHAAMKKSLADPTVAQRLADLGVQASDMTPEQFTAFVANQVTISSMSPRGIVAPGMRVQLLYEGQCIADGKASSKGRVEISGRAKTGVYEAIFHVGDWYREQRVTLPSPPFLDLVTYRFGISDPEQHYHLPFKCTPWGYSCFRGGA